MFELARIIDTLQIRFVLLKGVFFVERPIRRLCNRKRFSEQIFFSISMVSIMSPNET